MSTTDLFTSRPGLHDLRDIAWNAGMSPWALFAAVSARILACVPPQVQLPPLGAKSSPASLNMYFGIASPSGGGKSDAINTAENSVMILNDAGHLVDVTVRHPGSGEGLITALMTGDKEAETRALMTELLGKTTAEQALTWINENAPGRDSIGGVQIESMNQVEPKSLLLSVDEVSSLAALFDRSGTTLEGVLNSLWSGSGDGNLNASEDRARHLEPHSYRLTMLTGIQPGLSGKLLDRAVSGLPQRLLWVNGIDSDLRLIPDAECPTAIEVRVPQWNCAPRIIHVPDTVMDEIKARRIQITRGERVENGWDSHMMLAREKLAVVLSLLDQRDGDVTVDDWELSRIVWEHCRTVRDDCYEAGMQALAREKAKVEEARQDAKDAVSENRKHRAVNYIDKILAEGEGRFRLSDAKRNARRFRDDFTRELDRQIRLGTLRIDEQLGDNGKPVVWIERTSSMSVVP